MQEEAAEAMDQARLLLEQAVKRRKRKKKRKKKVPRTSSCSSCGRARRQQRQWHARDAGFPGDVSPRAVFPSSVGLPELPGILAGMFQKDSGVLIVDNGSGMSQGGFADISPRAVFLSIVAWPQMLGIMAVMDQKEFVAFLNPGNGMCKARIAGFAPRCVFPLVVGSPAGMSVWTRCTLVQFAGFTGDVRSCAVCSSFLSGPDARHYGWYEPE